MVVVEGQPAAEAGLLKEIENLLKSDAADYFAIGDGDDIGDELVLHRHVSPRERICVSHSFDREIEPREASRLAEGPDGGREGGDFPSGRAIFQQMRL